jgi:hypothetical protein
VPLSRRLWLDVVVLDAPRELVLVLPPGRLEWVWSFALEPAEGQRTRLTITTELSLPARGRIDGAAISAGFALFDVGHGVMEAVQFRTLARRVPAAERRSASG